MKRSLLYTGIALCTSWFLPLWALALTNAQPPALGTPPATVSGPPSHLDADAMALLTRAEAVTRTLSSLECDVAEVLHHGDRDERYAFHYKLMRPNFARVQRYTLLTPPKSDKSQLARSDSDAVPNRPTTKRATQPGLRPLTSTYSDGKTAWLLFPGNSSEPQPADPHGKQSGNFLLQDPVADFFDPTQSLAALVRSLDADHRLLRLACEKAVVWEGAAYQVVRLEGRSVPDEDGRTYTFTNRLYIGHDHLIHRSLGEDTSSVGSGRDLIVRNLRLNHRFAPAAFAFTPPPKPPLVVRPPAPALLAVGSLAPDFTVEDRAGKLVKLSDYRGKVVLLDFWATWCRPCLESLPHTNKVARSLRDTGVVVLAVNVFDSRKAFQRWLPRNPQYDALTFFVDASPGGKAVAETRYNVSSIPTQYLLDRQGRIRAHFVGYGGPTDTLARAIAAAEQDAPSTTRP